MHIKFSSVIAPLITTILFILGHGYLTTFVSIKMNALGHSEQVIGIVASSYYIGLVLGAFKIAKIIVKIGHLRVFTIFVGLFNTVCLLHILSDNVILWFFLRFIAGVALSGFFITVESWLLECSSSSNRGTTLALYMVALSSAQAASQLLLQKYNVMSLLPFIIITTLISLSIIPLAVSKNRKAHEHAIELVSMATLSKFASSSIAMCLTSGLLLSVIYSLLPVFFSELTNNPDQTSYLMFATLMGGLLQYPIGLLSDNFDRRKVIMGVSLTIVGILLFAFFVGHKNLSYTSLLIIYFILGGMSFTFYPMALSLVCDNLRSANAVSVSQKLSITEGVGAISGPVIAPLFIYLVGSTNGLSVYFVSTALCLIAFLVYRISVKERVSHNNFVIAMHTTPIAAELDPRSTEDEENI